jgi:tetratricopeptide (TPR) repeat protein
MQKERQPAYPLLYSFPGFRYCDMLLDQGREADVLARAAQTLEWAMGQGTLLLDIALDHLSLGRAHHLAAQKSAPPEAQRHAEQAAEHLQQAVDGLRRAGGQHNLPLSLLARAAFHLDTGARDQARHDLDEALALATRCGFRLHEADARLGLARLALAGETPALEARGHLDAARALLSETGYHRRDAELGELAGRLAEKR